MSKIHPTLSSKMPNIFGYFIKELNETKVLVYEQ